MTCTVDTAALSRAASPRSRLPSTFAQSLFYDTCSFYGPALRMAQEIVGARQLLWGADDPFIGAGPQYLDKVGFTQEEKALVLGGNAARIFKLAS